MQQLAISTKSISIDPTKFSMIKRNLLVVMAFALLWMFYAVAYSDSGAIDFENYVVDNTFAFNVNRNEKARAAAWEAAKRGDYTTAYKEWKPLAEQGEALAQVSLGVLYDQGHGVQQDYKTAVKWYRKAAKQGEALAQAALGWSYEHGHGVQQDYKTAAKWYRKAAEQGEVNSQFNLGILYYHGKGVTIDRTQAKKWTDLALAENSYGMVILDVFKTNLSNYKSRTTIHIPYPQTPAYSPQRLSFHISTKGNSSYVPVDKNLVRDIQSHLKALGYDLGTADGIQGRRTTAAVKAFQREWDIQPDGVLSSTLLKALKIALAAKSKSDQPVNKPVNKELSLAGSGTGFVIDSDYVVTNNHVIKNCSKLVIYINGNPVSGNVAASSDNDDLALIKLTKRVSYQASFRDSGRARLGEDIWVVGYPLRTLLASGLNVVSGEISALAGLGDNAKVMQISAPVQLGNSGGPLLDSSGNVIGVIVSKLDAKMFADAIGDIPQNINFAIKGAVVKSFLDINGIDYKTASSWAWTEKNGEELAAKAGEFTVPIECYK